MIDQQIVPQSETAATDSKDIPDANRRAEPWPDLLSSDHELASGLIEGESPAGGTEEILFALARAVEQRDGCTARHCQRLALISVTMGISMGLNRETLLELYRGAYLHDVGKVGIPDSILFKEGRLTPPEWSIMQSHPARGEEICRHLKQLAPILPVIRHHHERWDGSGYPDRLHGEDIPLLARVVQIADIYDALTNPRPYKQPYSVEKALNVIREESARGWRDPYLVKLFLHMNQDAMSKIAGTDPSLSALHEALTNLRTM